MPVILTKGRYPWGPGAKFDGNYVSSCTPINDSIVLRMDDRKHDDFWLELIIPKELITYWQRLFDVRDAEKRVLEFIDDMVVTVTAPIEEREAQAQAAWLALNSRRIEGPPTTDKPVN